MRKTTPSSLFWWIGGLLLFCLLVRLFLSPTEAKAEGLPCHLLLNVESVTAHRNYVHCEAISYGVDPELALFIVTKESGWNPRAEGDTHLTCPRTGKRQVSRGLFQINDCWNPDVPTAWAFSVPSSTRWAMPRLRTTPWIWSTYAQVIHTPWMLRKQHHVIKYP